MTKTAALALLIALAACGDNLPGYPTREFERFFADGRTVTVYGAHADEVCHAIAALACDGSRCDRNFLDRCIPPGGGILETPDVEAWDAMWERCIDSIPRLPGDYDGTKPIDGCWPLTPFWDLS